MLTILLVTISSPSVMSLTHLNSGAIRLAYLDEHGHESILRADREADTESYQNKSEAVISNKQTASTARVAQLNQSMKREGLASNRTFKQKGNLTVKKLSVETEGRANATNRAAQNFHVNGSRSASDYTAVAQMSSTNASANVRAHLNQTRQPIKAYVQNVTNGSRVYEVNTTSSPKYVSKVWLAIVNVLFLGICGVDRCLAGQICLGVVKGLTLGALGVWSTLDFIVITINCLGKFDELTWVGYDVVFYPGGVQPAFVLSLIFVILKVCMTCGCLHRVRLFFERKDAEK